MRRVAVTGMGILSPAGRGLSCNWEAIVNALPCIEKVTRFDISEYTSQIAGQVPFASDGTNKAGALNPDDVMSFKERRRVDDFILYGICAGKDAVNDAGIADLSEQEKENTGVIIGSGIGGVQTIFETSLLIQEKGPKRVSPFFVPASIANMAAGHLSIMFGFKGPSSAHASACATASHAIADSARLIMAGDADIMIAGGAEAAVSPLGFAGFCQARSLSTGFNDTPHKASRPWDKNRDGFVIGEGAGIVVLEELEHAKKRGAKIYAELTGYGLTTDAYHITAPDAEGAGAARAMRVALRKAGLNPEDIGYINAHGTSTVIGDLAELSAVKSTFASCLPRLAVSSTKGITGHLLGAAGGVESVYSIMALNSGVIPPTANLENPIDESEGVNLVPLVAQEKKLTAVLSNSFGFGGTNACLIFSAFSGK